MVNRLLKRIFKRFKQELKTFYLSYIRKYIRISSNPYISGDTFRKMSNHIFDERGEINLLKVKDNDILFIKTDYLEDFIENYIDKIDKKISLIFHNSDLSFDEKHAKYFTNKNFTVFSQNLKTDYTKFKNIYPLPIGLENRSYFMNGKLKNFNIVLNKSQRIEKNKLVLCGFNPNTNNDRKIILELTSQNENITFLRYSSNIEYLTKISEHKFNLCPEGNGADTHRFWETLLMGAIPIVKRSNLILNFEKFGIPMLILDDWKELITLNDEKLNKFYEINYQKLKNNDYIYFDYWKQFINKKSIET